MIFSLIALSLIQAEPNACGIELTDIHPSVSSVTQLPTELQIKPVEQREWLSNGEIKLWGGPVESVTSGIHVNDESGSPQRLYLGSYPLLGESEAMEALNSAKAAFKDANRWRNKSMDERIAHMTAFAKEMRTIRAEVVPLIMLEIGKTKADAEKEFDRTVEYIERTISAAKDLDQKARRLLDIEGHDAIVQYAPFGVVLNSAPYNYPLNESFTTLIPAIMMGNTVIFKHARHGVLLLRPFLKLFQKHFPPGVVNFIYGDGRTVITPMMKSGDVDVLAFIGRDTTAEAIISNHPRRLQLHLVLGLGAKNPGVIYKDADIDASVKDALTGCLSFNGQRCTALKILFVHKDIYQVFTEKLSAAVEKMKIGLPTSAGVQLTALPEKAKVREMDELVADAISKGAKILNPTGGKYHHSYYFPAILGPVTSEMKLYREEQFGPVIPIVSFGDDSEPIRYIETSRYRQQASLFSSNEETIAAASDELSALLCRVNPNGPCQRGPDELPFLGRGLSGLGILSIEDALLEFARPTIMAQKQIAGGKPTVVRGIFSKNTSKVFGAGTKTSATEK